MTIIKTNMDTFIYGKSHMNFNDIERFTRGNEYVLHGMKINLISKAVDAVLIPAIYTVIALKE